MNSLVRLLRRIPKRSALITAAIVAVAVPATIAAWGPDRETYTVANPADKVVFNSITDNPHVGDERNFVVIKDAANTQDGGWKDDVTVEPGKEYLVRMYVHNNAAANLDLVAENTRVKASVPTTTAKNVPISGFVSADNASPQEVWDDVSLNSDEEFNLAYVPGSARIYNNVFGSDGKALGDSIVTSAGAKVGYDKLDGKVPGCFEYASYVYFKVKPQFAEETNFTANKRVSKHGANKWVENYDAQPGETVDYLLEYKNTGDTQQNNVVIKDRLPAGMDYVEGSSVLGNALHPQGIATEDGVTSNQGINVGSYGRGSNAWVIFSAKAPTKDELQCGNNTLKNVVRVETDNGSREDDAHITVPKECEPEKPEEPQEVAYACKNLELIEKRSRDTFVFKVTPKTEGDVTVKEYTFDFGDNQTKTVSVGGEAQEHTYGTPGKYVAKVDISFEVNGKTVTGISGEQCEVELTVEQPPVTPEEPKEPEAQKGSPEELPSTGPASVIAGFVGSSALGYGLHTWMLSRRKVADAFRK